MTNKDTHTRNKIIGSVIWSAVFFGLSMAVFKYTTDYSSTPPPSTMGVFLTGCIFPMLWPLLAVIACMPCLSPGKEEDDLHIDPCEDETKNSTTNICSSLFWMVAVVGSTVGVVALSMAMLAATDMTVADNLRVAVSPIYSSDNSTTAPSKEWVLRPATQAERIEFYYAAFVTCPMISFFVFILHAAFLEVWFKCFEEKKAEARNEEEIPAKVQVVREIGTENFSLLV